MQHHDIGNHMFKLRNNASPPSLIEKHQLVY